MGVVLARKDFLVYRYNAVDRILFIDVRIINSHDLGVCCF